LSTQPPSEQLGEPDIVTFMQQRPGKGVSKAFLRRFAVETRREAGMLERVNGRLPVAIRVEAKSPGPVLSGVGG